MPIAKLDAEKCRQRNTLTALKGRNAVPVRLLLAPPAPATSARGTLPGSEAEALARINAILGKEGDESLKPTDVYLIYPEVGNTNFISDRFMFMGRKTLRNIADMASEGFAFMNSHRTGGMSQPTELPYGRTFAGRFEMATDESGNKVARTIVGAYMLRGQLPNGANGPTTDDLYAGIAGGTIFDVSLGLYGGACICDVCGEDLRAYDTEEGYLCPHVPGTTRKMSDEDIEAQKAAGVPGGVATYTLEDANAAEFSAVFDGAVPGAGFRKAVRLARSGRLSQASLAQANLAYKSLLNPSSGGRRAGRFSLFSKGQPMGFSLADILGKIRVNPEDAASLGISEDDDDEHDVSPRQRITRLSETSSSTTVDLSPQLKELQDQLAAEKKAREDDRAERDKERRDEQTAKILADAKAFASKAVTDRRLMPPGATDLTALHAYVHLSAAGLSTEGLDPVKALVGVIATVPSHNLTSEAVSNANVGNVLRLQNGSQGTEEASDEEVIARLKKRSNGAAAIAYGKQHGLLG